MIRLKREGLAALALALISVGATAFAPPQSAALPADPIQMLSTPTAQVQVTRAERTALPTLTAMPSRLDQAAGSWRAHDALAFSTATPTLTPAPTATPFPFDTRSDLPRYIYIDQWTQHMYIFEHGALLRDIPASCGLPDPDKYTEPWSGQVGKYWGTFYAFDVYADEAWYLYLSAGSILIHSLPYTLQNGYKVYQDRDALGVRPSSHGCIRIAPEDAVWLTQWNPAGVETTVTDPYLDRWRSILSR